MFARPLINSVDFARNGNEIRGEIGWAELPRLVDLLASTAGELVYGLRGFREGDRDMLELTLSGRCLLRCQRCLNELEYPVDLVSRFWLLPEDRMDEAEECDDLDAIEADSKLDVIALIEDELLLGLPFAPKHVDGECISAVNAEALGRPNPFAVLGKLKK